MARSSRRANALLGAPRTDPIASTRREKASITAPIHRGPTTQWIRVKSIIQMLFGRLGRRLSVRT